MDRHLRRHFERVELVTLVLLVVATPLLEILDLLRVFQTDIGPALLALLVANLAILLITIDTRVHSIDENVQVIRQAVREEVAVHREQIYVEAIDRLRELTVAAYIPARLYTPAGAWIADATYRWWYQQLADLVREKRIVLIAVYGVTPNRREFDQMSSVIEEDFAAMDRQWGAEGAEKGALFHVFPPSPPRPAFDVLIAGQQLAVLGFPTTPGYRAAERGLIITREESVEGLVAWFDNAVRPYAQAVNLTDYLVDGFASFAERYYGREAA